VVGQQLLTAWTDDIKFVLDSVGGKVNTSDVSGKFTGKARYDASGSIWALALVERQAAQLCHDDSRCKAGIDLEW